VRTREGEGGGGGGGGCCTNDFFLVVVVMLSAAKESVLRSGLQPFDCELNCRSFMDRLGDNLKEPGAGGAETIVRRGRNKTVSLTCATPL
jgi:hypothetical protein